MKHEFAKRVSEPFIIGRIVGRNDYFGSILYQSRTPSPSLVSYIYKGHPSGGRAILGTVPPNYEQPLSYFRCLGKEALVPSSLFISGALSIVSVPFPSLINIILTKRVRSLPSLSLSQIPFIIFALSREEPHG